MERLEISFSGEKPLGLTFICEHVTVLLFSQICALSERAEMIAIRGAMLALTRLKATHLCKGGWPFVLVIRAAEEQLPVASPRGER